MTFAYSVMKEKNIANVSTDRIFKLSAVEGERPLMLNKRTTFNVNAFKGDKQLHAIQEAGLWHLQYKSSDGSGAGNVPETLKQRWTNFNQLRRFLDSYFASRNIKIEEIIS